MHKFAIIAATLLLGLAGAARHALAAQPLQAWLDAAPAGTVLRLPAGTYSGPARITRSITLEGDGKAVIDGGGRGTVIIIAADRVILRGLVLRGSGDSHDAIDGGIMAQGEDLRIEDNRLEDVLFGISLHQVRNSVVRGNHIRSRPVPSADRGDGLRLWYSSDNRVENNDIAQVRDITVSNSARNRFVGNIVRDSRRAMNFLFARRSLVQDNLFEHNSSGVTALNSEGLLIRRNRIRHAMDAAGACIALKETSAALVQDNEILHCAHGVMADSPSNPINRIVLFDNRIAHNVTGIHFYGERGGHMAIGNRFRNNLWPVTVIGGGDAMNDTWWGNRWDDYRGFDRNGDGVGDTPHEVHTYADRIWLATPGAKFFRNSPVLELLDFLERLAPFSAPDLVLRDPAPRLD